MNAELAPPTESGLASPPSQVAIQGTLNNNRNSFNITSNHNHYHYSMRLLLNFNCLMVKFSDTNVPADGHLTPQRHRRIASGVPSLPSTPEEQSGHPLIAGQAPKFPSLPTHETTQVQEGIDDEYEHSIPTKSNHVFKSESSIYQASTSQVQHGRSKSQSFLSRISRSFTTLNRTLQPPNPRKPKLFTELNMKNVEDYLPKKIDQKYRNYICSPHMDQVNVIPVFDPSTARGVGIRRRLRIDVGDVGTFTMRGGFRVSFNILLDQQTNDLCGYDVPKDFSPFVPPVNSEQARSCYIKDDGDMIDLDKSAAIYAEAIDCRDPLSYGITFETPSKSFQDRPSPLFEISPQRTKDNRRGYIYLPYGARTYTFSPRARQHLKPYLYEQLPNWLEHLDGLREERNALPIILTTVWAARSFACATYKSGPSNTSPTVQLKATSGEKLEWTHAPEGFATMLAPMAEGYDQHDKLISGVENQCFAIEGFGVLLKKETSKSRR